MRFSFDGAEWSAWQPFAGSKQLFIPGPKGLTVVYAQLEGESGDQVTVFDTIFNDSETVVARSTENQVPGQQVMGGDMRVLQDQQELPPQREFKKWPIDAKGAPIVPLVFPVLGPVKWSDTFGAPRDGGKRKHMGQDLPAEKMRPLVAAISGTVYLAKDTLSIQGDDGVSCSYIHLNNDSPGTDDGKAGPEFTFAPGLKSGDRVEAGQFVGYNGDSGNAENTIPHLHFELHVAGYGTVNAYTSLMRAQKLEDAKPVLIFPETLPGAGMTRIDLHFERYDAEKNELIGFVISETNKAGKTKMVTKPMRKVIALSTEGLRSIYQSTEAIDLLTLSAGDRIVVIGKPKRGREFETSQAFADKPSASSTTLPTVIDPPSPGR
jgi:murein DD-endopeptidase MepM/ murein hydrolase activator NlpD